MIRTLAIAAFMLSAASASAAPAGPPAAWDGVARVVVFGDLHGDYGKFHDMLMQAGLVDARDRWSGGAAHLVQLGDVPDRAPDTRRIVDLLMRLEPQARRAGGYVHALVGNHEAMNMEGDLRYTTAGEFAAFADRNSARRRDAFYQRVVAAIRAKPPATGVPVFDAAYRAAFDAAHPLGWVEHQSAWSPQGAYGRWVLGHSAIVRINDTLYLHGGISPEFRAFDVDVMNRAVSAALRHEPARTDGPKDILWSEQGPLWYRGMAQNDEATERENVAAVLARYKVRHVVIGHTKRYTMVSARFDGAVILADIAPPAGCAEPHAFLVQDGDAFAAMHRGQRLALGLSGAAQTAYVSQVAALDQAVQCRVATPASGSVQ